MSAFFASRIAATLLLLTILACAGATTQMPAAAQQSSAPTITQAVSWKMLVLIYTSTNAIYTDAGGQHQLVAHMDDTERTRISAAATRFVTTDIPALTSGAMRPSLTIRYPARALSSLTPGSCNDFTPSPDDTQPERDPGFDSIIVLWDGSGVDALHSNQPLSVVGCAYGWPMGTAPTYAAIFSDFIGPSSRDRNVFKHEWGHSILFYFDAAGTAPKPAVDNHINDSTTRYVNCHTGQPYILADETDDNLIPNSIYNNESGFTHDYYSGQTATADQPNRCLGITPAAWQSGGPVTRPSHITYVPVTRT